LATGAVVSRDNGELKCVVVPAANAEYILSVIDSETEIVLIDEAQFFEARLEPIQTYVGNYLFPSGMNFVEVYPIVAVVQTLSDMGLKVVVVGLDMDSDRKPFGPMPHLMAISDEVKKIHAVCEICHKEAVYSYIGSKSQRIQLGDNEYTAVCPDCYSKLQKPDVKLYRIPSSNGKPDKKILIGADGNEIE
jgi:thymidine kinase